jgi:primosomal protein N'
MFIVSVIPIARALGKEELTYFTSEKVSRGQLVSVPLRKKNTPALVVSIHDASKEKALLKRSRFSLKKVAKVHPVCPLSEPFSETITNLADYYETTVGSCITALMPKALLVDPIEVSNPVQNKSKQGLFDECAFQDLPKERESFLRTQIRELFAQNKSVLILAPTQHRVEVLTQKLSRGIENYVVSLHSGVQKKKIRALWEHIQTEPHPLCIVSTPGFLGLKRTDIGLVVVEDELSKHYRGSTRPFIDGRVAARFFAEALGAEYWALDTLLQTETYARFSSTHSENETLQKRYTLESSLSVVDMRYDEDIEKPAVLSAELKKRLISLKAGERAFIFVARRGLAPVLRCRDCGTPKTCPTCHSLLTLHSAPTRHLRCHRCATRYPVEDACTVCKGMRIDTLGIGTSSIEKELLKLHLSVPIIQMDSDTITTQKALDNASARFENEGGVLIGTEMAFPFLENGVKWSAVATLDALLALPHFRMNERLFALLLQLRINSKEEVLIQTRAPENPLFSYTQKGTLKAFQENELATRKMLGYPPYKVLVLITRRGNELRIKKDMENLKELFSTENPQVYPAFHSQKGTQQVLHLLLKQDSEKWPNPDVAKKLRALSPQYEIHINPESIF